jgi:hypothetical protein
VVVIRTVKPASADEIVAYTFNGILSNESPVLPLPDDSPEKVYRAISHSDIKVGVLFPEREIGVEYGLVETNRLLAEIALQGIINGVLLEYCTWAGPIDHVGVAKVSNSQVVVETYKEYQEIEVGEFSVILARYGIAIEKSGYFVPFTKGYWGKYGD